MLAHKDDSYHVWGDCHDLDWSDESRPKELDILHVSIAASNQHVDYEAGPRSVVIAAPRALWREMLLKLLAENP